MGWELQKSTKSYECAFGEEDQQNLFPKWVIDMCIMLHMYVTCNTRSINIWNGSAGSKFTDIWNKWELKAKKTLGIRIAEKDRQKFCLIQLFIFVYHSICISHANRDLSIFGMDLLSQKFTDIWNKQEIRSSKLSLSEQKYTIQRSEVTKPMTHTMLMVNP